MEQGTQERNTNEARAFHEDESRFQEAFTAYAQAIAVDPDYAEAHFNIAKLYEHAGDDLAAVRHLRAYRELTKS